MTYVHVDDKARICLTREIVDRYGQEFVIVPAKDEILLIPLAKDPIKALQEEGKKIPNDLSVSDLKKLIRKRATRNVLERMERRERDR